MRTIILVSFLIILNLPSNIFAQVNRIRKQFDEGTVLVLFNNDDEFNLSTIPYQGSIAGIATGNSAPVKRSDLITEEGNAYVKFNSENGIISSGDPVTSSSVPGEAMKATQSGIILGIATEDATTPSGLIQVRVLIQYLKQ